MEENKRIYVIQGVDKLKNRKAVMDLIEGASGYTKYIFDNNIGVHNAPKISVNIESDIMSFAKNKSIKGSLYVELGKNSRKYRRHLYNQIKTIDSSIEVIVVIVAVPFADTNNVKLHDYVVLDVPRLEVDCDDVIVYTEYNWFDVSNVEEWNCVEDVVESAQGSFKDEIEKIIGMEHDNAPYHMESISEHINMVAESDFCNFDRNTKLIGLFHDLGKAITKSVDDKGFARYRNHDRVSSMYLLVLMSMLDGLNTQNMSAVEVVYQHMKGHKGITKRNEIDNKLDRLKYTIDIFNKVDSDSAIRGADYDE